MNSSVRNQLMNLNSTLITSLLSEMVDEVPRQDRRYHVSPYHKERSLKGRFHTDFNDLCSDQKQFAANFHMSVEAFNMLYEKVLPHLLPKQVIRKDIISPKEKLAIVLEFLASGDIQRHISSCYRISKQHFSNIIDQVCSAIITELRDEIPKWSAENLRSMADNFKEKCNFPNCVGALDGKHVAMRSPPNSGSLFYNYKGYFSIVIMAVCDVDARFTFLDVGACGSEGDANVFRNSTFGRDLINDRLSFPQDEEVGGSKLPFFLVADDAFPLCKRIMKPFSGKQLSNEERIYNYRLSRARMCIEHAFGILAWRWLSLQKKLFCKPDRAQKIVTACCLLHNFLIAKDNAIYTADINNKNDILDGNLSGLTGSSGRTSDHAKSVRSYLKEFVNSPSGSVAWQKKAAGIE